MSATIRGYQGAVFQGSRRSFRPGVGWQTVSRFACPDAGVAQGLAGANSGGSNHVDLDDSGPPYMVEIASPDDGTNEEQPEISIYELSAMDETPDIYESALFRQLDLNDTATGTTNFEKGRIRNYRNSAQSTADWSQWVELPYTDDITNLTYPALTGDALALARMIRNGQDSFYRATSEFRWTRTVTDAQLATASAQAFNSVARIFTSSTLNSSVAPPLAWQSAVTNATTGITAQGTGYSVGWLKYQPTITRKGLNKNEIALRWILNSWNTALYGAAI